MHHSLLSHHCQARRGVVKGGSLPAEIVPQLVHHGLTLATFALQTPSEIVVLALQSPAHAVLCGMRQVGAHLNRVGHLLLDHAFILVLMDNQSLWKHSRNRGSVCRHRKNERLNPRHRPGFTNCLDRQHSVRNGSRRPFLPDVPWRNRLNWNHMRLEGSGTHARHPPCVVYLWRSVTGRVSKTFFPVRSTVVQIRHGMHTRHSYPGAAGPLVESARARTPRRQTLQ
mmetsp:Transcript_61201/g.162665  ORF Transcript_61201/g.162665 Transcript_61201/m.162665 type:complete len:226 (-) Transcript_61201:52-729(-)